MKLAIISDLHGNSQALFSFYMDVKENGLDHIICLGDIIERGFNQYEERTIDYLKCINKALVIKGNHDKMVFAEDTTISYMNRMYLDSLPEELELKNILAFHSSLREPEYYMFGNSDIEKEYRYMKENQKDFEYYLFGHTHQRAVYQCNPKNHEVQNMIIKHSIFLKPGFDYFINPGGLCIHSLSKKSYAILDTEKRILKFKDAK